MTASRCTDKIEESSRRTSRKGRSLGSAAAYDELCRFQESFVDEIRCVQERSTKFAFQILLLAIMLLAVLCQATTRLNFESTLMCLAFIPTVFCQIYIGYILFSSVRLHHFDIKFTGINGINALRVPSKLIEENLEPVTSISALCHCVGSTSYYVLSMSVTTHFCFACAVILCALQKEQCTSQITMALLLLASEFGGLLIGTTPVQKDIFTWDSLIHLSGVALAEFCSLIGFVCCNFGAFQTWSIFVALSLIGTGAVYILKKTGVEATTFKELIDVHTASRNTIVWEWLNVTFLGIVMLSNTRHLLQNQCF